MGKTTTACWGIDSFLRLSPSDQYNIASELANSGEKGLGEWFLLLLKTARERGNTYSVFLAVRALRKQPAPEAIPVLEQLYFELPDSIMGAEIIGTLGEIAEDKAIPVILRGLGDNRSRVQEAAIYAIPKIHRTSPDQVIAGLRNMIRKGCCVERINAIRALTLIASPEAIALLCKAIQGEKEASVLTNVVPWLQNVKNHPEIRAILQKLAQSSQHGVCSRMAQMILEGQKLNIPL